MLLLTIFLEALLLGVIVPEICYPFRKKEEIYMYSIHETIKEYIQYCREQRRLDKKTIKAYQNDLTQFADFCGQNDLFVAKDVIKSYIASMHEQYKQKTVKRKIASIKAFYNYLENEEIIEINPMRKIKTEFREERILPRTIPASTIELLLRHMYAIKADDRLTLWEQKILIRDISVVELLFATGLRISELCNLKTERIDLEQGILCIKGKGAKERYLQVGNQTVLQQLNEYANTWKTELVKSDYFFHNRYGQRYSEQSARRMIQKYVTQAQIDMHITPHMFRHAFATLLLEEDVDIRYIQKMLGHSSIVTTQIYTEVASKKQMEILKTKHPRNRMKIVEKSS